MDETDFIDTTVNLISGSFPEHEGDKDMTPCVLRKTDLRINFARESSSTRTQLFESPSANANDQLEHVSQLNTPRSVCLCTYFQADILKLGDRRKFGEMIANESDKGKPESVLL